MADPIRTTGARYRRDSRKGLRTITRVFDDLRSEDECDSLVVTNPPLGLPEVGREGEQADDGRWKLVVTFEGVTDDTELGEVWSIDFASNQSPIQAFRHWERFKAKFGAVVDEDGQLKGFPPKIKIGTNMVQNPAYGVEAFDDPRAILKVRIVARQIDDVWYENLGKIDTPRPKRFRLPALKDGRNWKKDGCQVNERGNAVEGEIAWKLSGEGGWLGDIYLPK